jgi:ADP-heptose:LPS heptosyltransferase
MKFLKLLDKRQTDLKHLDPSRVKAILVVSSTAIGDTLLSTPAIRAVRKRYPHANIFAHFNIKNMELFENNPDINGIIPYYRGYKKFFKTVREFRRRNFDLVLIFHGNEPQATPMAYLSGARFIIKIPRSRQYGFLLSNRSNGFDNPWDHHAIDVRFMAASFARCAADDKEMVLIPDKNTASFIDEYVRSIGIGENAIIVGFQAGAATRYKMWPKENFIELGRRLLACNPALRIILTGSKHEKNLCDAIAEEIGEGALSASGRISLKQMSALVKKMHLLVTNDTGTMHIAIALKTKTVSLFCPTNYQGVGPIQDTHLHTIVHKDRPCNPCTTKKCATPSCMRLITVDEVFKAVQESLP